VDKKTNEDVAESGRVFFKDPYLDSSVEEEVHKEFERYFLKIPGVPQKTCAV
jgi:hypothetical protein